MNKPSTVKEYIDSTSCPMAAGLYVDDVTQAYLQTRLDEMARLWPTIQQWADIVLPVKVREEWGVFKEEYSDLLALTVAFSAAGPEFYAPDQYDAPHEVIDAYDDFTYNLACFNGVLDYLGSRM